MAKVGPETVRLLEPLTQVRGVFRVRPHNRNLRIFFTNTVIPLIEQGLDEGCITVIRYASMQGGGKSRVRKIGEQVTENEFPNARKVTHTYTEEAPTLRQLGRITTGPLDIRRDVELNSLGLASNIKLLERLERGNVDIIHDEEATINGIPLRKTPPLENEEDLFRAEDDFFGWDIGGKSFRFLLQENPKLPKYRVLFIGQNVGPIQLGAAMKERTLVKEANSLSTLQQVCKDIGLLIPQSEDERIQMQLDGASPATMMKLYRALPYIAREVRRQKTRILIPVWMRQDRKAPYQTMISQHIILEYYRNLIEPDNPHIQRENFFNGLSERPVPSRLAA